MIVWSSLRPIVSRPLLNGKHRLDLKCFMSGGHHRVFPLESSKWQWHKFKNYIHFYVLLGVIPLTLLSTFVNIFIGPATLTEIPAGYTPKHWEYYRHPITRFIARYITDNPQQDYEKFMHHIFEEDEKMKMMKIEQKIKAQMRDRQDYQAYYYRPIMAKYHRLTSEVADSVAEIVGGD